MSGGQKVGVYLVGVAIGCFLLALIPREEKRPQVHPWHAQTAPEGTYPMTVEDDYGRTLELSRQPRHLISLAPSITEMLFAMGMGDHLLAVTRHDTYPAEAKALRDAGAQVGDMDQPNRERIATYRPDMILATTHTPQGVIEQIHTPPATVAAALEHSSYEKVRNDIRWLGTVLGVPGKALDLLARLDAEMDAVDAWVAEQSAPSDTPTVLFVLGLEANLHPGFSPGSDSWVTDLIERAGGVHFVKNVGTSWGMPSLESVMTADPDVLLIRDALTPSDQIELQKRIRELPEHPVWQHVRAVREGRVHVLEPGPLTIPGPRMPAAYRSIAEAIHR